MTVKMWARKIKLFEASILFCLLSSTPTAAQIVPDATLPNNSQVTIDENTSIINGGTQAGGNLFHSFEQFSIPTDGTAYFNNAASIQNIISRITGRDVSNIDGLIRANGSANLFLLNPNGFIFGSNASLNIGGSFLVSTASSLNFADETQFSAIATQTVPLLSVNVPIGLQVGENPAGIQVQDKGHDLRGSGASPVIRGNSPNTGLRVQPGKTLALVGGDVNLVGGILTAEGGHIELGSVDHGLVSFSLNKSDWVFGYKNVSVFKDIQLSQRSLADASGAGSGSIRVQGRLVSLRDGSVILIQNQGLLPARTLSVSASESLRISGTDPVARIIGGLGTGTLGFGDGADITIFTPQLLLEKGGTITTRTYGVARAGNITAYVPDSLQLIGTSPIDFRALSTINSVTFSSGQAGNVTALTGQLTAMEGGNISSATSDSGAGGNVTVKATNSIELIGVEKKSVSPSFIGATTLSEGDAGEVTIETPRLVLNNGGRVDSSTGASGKAGSVTIKARDSVEVRGTVLGSRNPSLIISSANVVDKSLQKIYGLPEKPSGGSGGVFIETGRLDVKDGGLISVRNDGIGNAGTLQITANSINLDSQGGITAATASGKGGEIYLQAQNLQLQNNSTITAAAGLASPENNQLSENSGDRNGGNITIGTGTLTALENSKIDANAVVGNGGNVSLNIDKSANWENSSITANALQGNGGNLTIDTNKLLSLRNSNFSANAAQGSGGNLSINASVLAITRNSSISANAIQGNGGIIDINAQGLFRSPDSSITANSQYGINGTVQINNLVTNPSNGLINLPVQPFDASKLVAQDCNGSGSSIAEGSSFIVTGRGGLPAQLGEPLTSEALIINGKSPKPIAENRLATVNTTPKQLVEATGWVMNDQGEVVLTEQPPSGTVYSSDSPQATCYAP